MMMGGEDEVQQETCSTRGRKSALQTREVNFGYAPTKVLAMLFLSLIAFVITMYLLLFTNCCCICLLAVQYYMYLIAFLISTDILKKWYVHTVNT